MNPSSSQPTNRLNELLAESMLRALLPDEIRELEELAGTEANSCIAHAEQAAAGASIIFAEQDTDVEPMPASLQAKLQEQAADHFAGRSSTSLPGPGSERRLNRLPWLLTAAAGIVAVLGWLPRFSSTSVLSGEEMLQGLVAEAPSDLLRLDWTVLEDPASIGASGELLWSDSEQRGYMRFRGLAANDASQSQYQLWIFDDKTDTNYPVDGGVFNILAGADEVIVAIDPKINVKEAFQFAITVEAPGGVVVSKRERIPLLAAVPG
jgi:hypothetical protein